MTSSPFIVTAELPPEIFRWADGLRRTHFPPERNWLQAHVTLFHSFAPSLRGEVLGLLSQIAASHAAPPARIDGLMNLGNGTALAITSPGLLAIRAGIADHFHGALTAQDQHPRACTSRSRTRSSQRRRGRFRQSWPRRWSSAGSSSPGWVSTAIATRIGKRREHGAFAANRVVDQPRNPPYVRRLPTRNGWRRPCGGVAQLVRAAES